MTRVVLRLIMTLVLAWVVVIGLAQVVGRALPPEDEIIFSAQFDGRDYDIYRMSLSRGLMTAITHNEGADLQPAWSPDGQTIAFSSTSNQQNHIYTMNEYGDDVRLITRSKESEYHPVWSPDGRSIAYERLIYIFSSVLMLTDVQSGETGYLTDGDSGSSSPAWSPDGGLIAFAADPNKIGFQNIYTVDIRNRALRLLIRSEENTSVPAWSPDGRYLSYISGSPGKQAVRLWDIARSQSISLGITADYITAPAAWSPDGRFLLLTLPAATITNSTLDTALFKLDVQACLSGTASCQPLLLSSRRGYYFYAGWRPRQP